MFEIINMAAQRLGWTVEWTTETSFSEFPQELYAQKFDAMCGIAWPVSARAHKVDFARPLWYSGIGAWVRDDDDRFRNIEQLNTSEITISAIDGTLPFYLAQERFPKAQLLSLPALSDYTSNMLNVQNKKADVTFTEIYQGNAYLAQNPNRLKNIVPNAPLSVYANSLSVKKGEIDLINTLNTALTELLHSGYVDKIIKTYDNHADSFYFIQKPYQN